MTFFFTYEQDYSRIIPAVEIDARATNPIIANQIGDVIKAYCDNVVAKVVDNVIPYRIETDMGNMAGYFCLQVNTTTGGVLVYLKKYRPGFANFTADLDTQIQDFATSGLWKADYLGS